jgi:hypothetical protein
MRPLGLDVWSPARRAVGEDATDMSNKTINAWDWDIRVRERNMKSGALTDKDVEKHTGQLPDLAEQTDPVTISQPALGGREG